jgi:hypothetical protein
MIMKNLKWFVDRIWKTVYRNKWTCKCMSCKDTEENGLVIYDENHANYLHMVEWDMQYIYRDNP